MWRSTEIQENGEQLNFFVKYQRNSLGFLKKIEISTKYEIF